VAIRSEESAIVVLMQQGYGVGRCLEPERECVSSAMVTDIRFGADIALKVRGLVMRLQHKGGLGGETEDKTVDSRQEAVDSEQLRLWPRGP
jgi:hypothetical protein